MNTNSNANEEQGVHSYHALFRIHCNYILTSFMPLDRLHCEVLLVSGTSRPSYWQTLQMRSPPAWSVLAVICRSNSTPNPPASMLFSLAASVLAVSYQPSTLILCACRWCVVGPFIACSCVSQRGSKFPFHFAFVALSTLISPPFRIAVAPVGLHQRLLAPFSNTRSTASTQARRLPTMGAQGSKPPKITSHDRAILDLKVARDKIRIYSKKVRVCLSPSGGRCDRWIEDEKQAFCRRQSSLLQ